MSTHNPCFGAKVRKIGIPLHTPVLLYKSEVQGVYITQTCFPDGKNWTDWMWIFSHAVIQGPVFQNLMISGAA